MSKLWSRRGALARVASSLGGPLMIGTASTSDAQSTMVAGAGRTVAVKLYRAVGLAKRPGVLILHGSQGLDAHAQAYEAYARALAAAGLDAYLFSYYKPDEARAIRQASNALEREALYAHFVDGWVSLIRTLSGDVLRDPLSSGKTALLGFSLGGMIGVAAANDWTFSALAVLYAGVPTFSRRPLSRLPPLLDIHGDGDRAVSLASGEALVATARRLGGVADLVVFRREGHGFDLNLGDPNSVLARNQAVAFLSGRLTETK